MLGANHIPETTTVPPSNASEVALTQSESSEEFVCAFYNPDFIIVSSIGSFYIPCCVMIYLYSRIFMVSEVLFQWTLIKIRP